MKKSEFYLTGANVLVEIAQQEYNSDWAELQQQDRMRRGL